MHVRGAEYSLDIELVSTLANIPYLVIECLVIIIFVISIILFSFCVGGYWFLSGQKIHEYLVRNKFEQSDSVANKHSMKYTDTQQKK